jgi:hypothetical protein
VDFFVTAIVVVISAVMTYLFTTGMLCAYRDWVDAKRKEAEEADAERKEAEEADAKRKQAEEAKDEKKSPFILFYKTMKAGPDDWPVGKMVSVVFSEKHYDAVLLVAVLALYSGIFTFVSPGLNAILLPHPFSRLRPLQGHELDFSSTDTTCMEWVVGHPIPPLCNWRVSVTTHFSGSALNMSKEYNGFEFTDCLGENQLVDVLEAGRSNVSVILLDDFLG